MKYFDHSHELIADGDQVAYLLNILLIAKREV